MNDLTMVQGNQGVNQTTSGGSSRKSESKSDSGVDFGAIFNKATENTTNNDKPIGKNETKNETKSDSDRGVGRNKGKSDDDNNNVGRKKDDEKEVHEEYVAANGGTQGSTPANDTPPADDEPVEEVSSTDNVSTTEGGLVTDGDLSGEDEGGAIDNLSMQIFPVSIEEEITIDTDTANKFKDFLENFKKGQEDGHNAHAIHGGGHGKGKGDKVDNNRNDVNIGSEEEGDGIFTFPEPGETGETGGTDNDFIIIGETDNTGDTGDTSQIDTFSIDEEDFDKNTTTSKEDQQKIIDMEKTLISSFPAKYEEPIDTMTRDFLARNPNPTIAEFASFLESVNSAIKQIMEKDNEIAKLNDALDALKTDLNAAAAQMTTFQQVTGDLSVQDTLSDLSTNLQRMFAEIATSAQMTSPGTTSQLVLQLYPEHLGKLRIELTADLDGKITAKMQSGNAAVRALLDSGIRDLIDCLKASGIDLKSLEVGKLEMELSNSDLGHRSNLQQNNQQNQQNQQNSRQNQSSITRIMAANPRMLTSALYNSAIANSYIDENVSVEFTA